MKYLDEFRDPSAALRLVDEIRATATRPRVIMEVCGGQTHSIVRHGLDQLLDGAVSLIHGPGCPVCVTPLERIDRAVQLASRGDVTLCTFGDMLRVPGSHGDLARARAAGGDVRVVLSPADTLALAAARPQRQFVLFAVGFETTAPTVAFTLREARRRQLGNLSVLLSHVRVPPALEAILRSEGCEVEAFLAAGHVCSVMGTAEYLPIAARHRVPVVVTGFEPIDLLCGIRAAITQLEAGRAVVENCYARAVQPRGSPSARAVLDEVFEVSTVPWRGLGAIDGGGLALRDEYRAFDATRRFAWHGSPAAEDRDCRAGEVLTGRITPRACAEFGRRCTPDHPLGAPMVSGEGACAAYFRYGSIR